MLWPALPHMDSTFQARSQQENIRMAEAAHIATRIQIPFSKFLNHVCMQACAYANLRNEGLEPGRPGAYALSEGLLRHDL